jgi:hypothetical protein
MSKNNKFKIRITGNILNPFFLPLFVFVFLTIGIVILDLNILYKILDIIFSFVLIVSMFILFSFRYEYDDECLEINSFFSFVFAKRKILLKNIYTIEKFYSGSYLIRYDNNLICIIISNKKSIKKFVEHICSVRNVPLCIWKEENLFKKYRYNRKVLFWKLPN